MKKLCLLLAVLSAGGCKWSEFDDLKDDAVVSSIEKPDNNSTVWGIGLLPARRAASGQEAAVLGVVGASEPIYNEIVYGANGGAHVGTRLVEFEDLGFSSFPLDPIVTASPDTDDTAIVAFTDKIHVLRGNLSVYTDVPITGSMAPGGATYIHPTGGTGEVLAVVDRNMLYAIPAQGTPSIPCILSTDTGFHAQGIATIHPAGASEDKLAVWSEDGHLYQFPNSVLLGNTAANTICAGAVQDPGMLVTSTETTFHPGDGSRLLELRNAPTDPVTAFVAYGKNTTGSQLQVFSAQNDADFTPVGQVVTVEAANSATILHSGGTMFTVLGFQNASVEGVGAGQVKLYDTDPVMGVNPSVALILNDAQPEDSQQFGRSVAALPYNGTEILAVAADNEVFTYYRTELYDETRNRGQ